jgi:predicted amidohydrolase YtcJ
MRLSLLIATAFTAAACAAPVSVDPTSTESTASPATVASQPVTAPAPSPRPTGSVMLVGRIVTMAEPAVAEALLIEDGVVTAVGARDEVVASAGEDVPVIELGDNVAYPGFIDAHAHWIGDRNYYRLDTPAEAMDAAIQRGWTSISEQWDDADKLDELLGLAADNALPLRVDSYLALNGVHPGEHYGDWYADREPGPVGDRLRVRGLKIHLDNGSGAIMLWEQDELTAAIGRANEAGWQVSVHAVSTEAMDMVLDAFEAAIGPNGPNPLHHRIEHALQVTDDQLARMVALDLAIGGQLDGVATDWVRWAATTEDDEYRRNYENGDVAWLGRWRDFVEAGLHVAGTSDAPWFFPNDFTLSEDVGRPVDEIAGGMDGRGREFPEPAPWALDQLLTAEQGLRAVTLDAAWALGDEANRGHLTAGAYGDVTILSRDVTQGTPDEIRSTTVVATIVDGVTVYCGAAALCAD